jgi:YHYH protein
MKFRRDRYHPHAHPPPHPYDERGQRRHSQEYLFGESQVRTFIQDSYRYIVCNGLPNHEIGPFVNRSSSNTVRPQQYFFRVPINPSMAEQIVAIHRQPFGVAINGVTFDPESVEFWNSDRHSGWQYEAMSRPGLDGNNGHIRNGAFHYHGLPVGLIASVGSDSQMLMVGYAADGFPIYTQYDYCDPTLYTKSSVIKVLSSYQLKQNQRRSGPRGEHDGTFVQDYEYVARSGDLDRCNGHFGVTPEYPHGIYHYHITEMFPFIPRCLRGAPDPSFQHRRSNQ